MNEGYCYDHIASYNDTRSKNKNVHYDSTTSQTSVDDKEEDIQTIQSDAMTTSVTLYHGDDDHSKKRFLSSPSLRLPPESTSSSSSSSLPFLNSTTTRNLTPSTKILDSTHQDSPPSPSTTTSMTKSNTLTAHQTVSTIGIPPNKDSRPHPSTRTLIDTDLDIPPEVSSSPPVFLSSSQSLLYHTLTPTTPSPIMDVIDNRDHSRNNSSNQYHDDRGRIDRRRIHDVDNDNDQEENENYNIHEVKRMNTNEPRVDDIHKDSHINPLAHEVVHNNHNHDGDPVEVASTMSYSTIMSSLSGHEYFDTMTNYYTDDDDNSKCIHHPPTEFQYDKDAFVDGNRRPKMVYDLTGTTTTTTTTITKPSTGWTTAALFAASTWSTAYEDEDDDEDDHAPKVLPPKQDPSTIIVDTNEDNNRFKKSVTNSTSSGTTIYQLKQRFVCSSVFLILLVMIIVGLTFGLYYGNGSFNGNDLNNTDDGMTTNQTSGVVKDATNSLDEQDNAINNTTTDNIDKSGPHPAPTPIVITTNSPTGSPTDSMPLPTAATSLSPTNTNIPAPSTNIVTAAPSFSEQNVDSVPSPDLVQSPPTTRPQRQPPPTSPMISVAIPIPTPSSFVRRPTVVGIAPAPVRRIRTPVRAPVVARAPRPPTPTTTTTTTTTTTIPVRALVAPTTTNIPPPMTMTTLSPTIVDDDPTLEPSSLLLTLPTISPVTITSPPSTISDIVTNTISPTNVI